MEIVRGSDVEFAPASHERADAIGVVRRVLATKDAFQAGQVMMLNWAQLPVGSSFQSHYHEDMQEAFLIIQGCATMTVDGKDVELDRGDLVIIAPREIHSMKNTGEETTEFVVFGIASGTGGRTVVVEGGS